LKEAHAFLTVLTAGNAAVFFSNFAVQPASATSASATTASKKKGQEEEDTSPPLKPSNGKEQRFKDEKSLKVICFVSWNKQLIIA
jgi:hypothetical protein